MQIIIALVFLAVIAFVAYSILRTNKPVYKVPKNFPKEWQEILETNVHFYQNLNREEKTRFEEDIRHFLEQVRVTGIRTEIDDLDRLLAACSAVIPLFGFPEWEYNHLDEVLIYPKAFDRDFSMDNPKETILGMVGTGNAMDGIMLLSKPSLRGGFTDPNDKQNVGIHEFVHILDKQDGSIDGVPGLLNNPEYIAEWKELVQKKIREIKEGKSDIDAYGATNEQEFLAVASEYFFERPKKFRQKHPEVYRLLHKVYAQNMEKRLENPFRKRKEIGRNSDCPCGSGEKFKNCCAKN